MQRALKTLGTIKKLQLENEKPVPKIDWAHWEAEGVDPEFLDKIKAKMPKDDKWLTDPDQPIYKHIEKMQAELKTLQSGPDGLVRCPNPAPSHVTSLPALALYSLRHRSLTHYRPSRKCAKTLLMNAPILCSGIKGAKDGRGS